MREGGRAVSSVGEGRNHLRSLDLELQLEVAWQILRG